MLTDVLAFGGTSNTDSIGQEGAVFTEFFMQNCSSERQWIFFGKQKLSTSGGEGKDSSASGL